MGTRQSMVLSYLGSMANCSGAAMNAINEFKPPATRINYVRLDYYCVALKKECGPKTHNITPTPATPEPSQPASSPSGPSQSDCSDSLSDIKKLREFSSNTELKRE